MRNMDVSAAMRTNDGLLGLLAEIFVEQAARLRVA